MSYDFNDEFKAYLRRSVEAIARQVKSWRDESACLFRCSRERDSLRRKQNERRGRWLEREARRLAALGSEYEAELREQERWGLPGLMFEGAEVEGWCGMRLHGEVNALLVEHSVMLTTLTERERAEAEREAEREVERAKREERRRKQREARKAEAKRRADAARRRGRLIRRVREKGGWR